MSLSQEEYHRLVAAEMTEAVLQQRVNRLAAVLGFAVYHTHDSRRSQAGYPDCTLLREGRLVFAELKSQRGRVRPEQRVWLDELAKVPGAEVYLWRPVDLLDGTVEGVLRGDG